MKLGQAHMCLNCEEIFIRASGHSRCPSCASLTSIPLAKFIEPMVSIKESREKAPPSIKKYISSAEKSATFHL
jgi:uncharacterized Zn finger protein (UPF0148 family)